MTDETHECPTCGGEYSCRSTLERHHRNVHGENLAEATPGEAHPCPNCDKAFESPTALNRHHGQVHDGKAAGIKRECGGCGKQMLLTESTKWRKNCSQECRRTRVKTQCAWCGSTLERIPWRVSVNDKQFCDAECHGQWTAENRNGKNSTNWEEREKRECAWCGDEIERRPSYPDVEHWFCPDKDCYGKWRSKNKSGEDNPRWVGCKKTECEICGEVMQIRPWEEKRTCGSSECISELRSGKNHPRWKGGYEPYYGPNWREQRRRARERDNHECQACGKTQEENGRELDVHHITPFREFVDDDGNADYEAANDLDNLISLCKSCHREYEGLPVVPRTAN